MIDKTGTVAIEQGDMLILNASTGKVHAASASANGTGLIGIAAGKSPTTDATATPIRVWLTGHGTVFECVTASNTYTFGNCFTIGGAQTLTAKTVVNISNTGTNVVAFCAQDKDTAGTKVLVEFLPSKYGQNIASS
jgi:hypothetical protein